MVSFTSYAPDAPGVCYPKTILRGRPFINTSDAGRQTVSFARFVSVLSDAHEDGWEDGRNLLLLVSTANQLIRPITQAKEALMATRKYLESKDIY